MHIAAEFKIPYFQYLNEHGCLKEHIAISEDKDLLLHYYRTMVFIQLFDKKAIALQRTGKMGTYAPINGQEALGTAIGICLDSKDIFIPYYRDYATLYLRDIPLSDILNFWGGDERSSRYSDNSHDFPLCVPIASQCLHAAGVATALKYKKSDQVALVTLGDGATSEGDFYEAMNVAGVWNLPIIFVILNNQWAISVPYEKQTKCQTLAQKAIAAGIEGVQVDGNDVFALHDVLSNAIKRARGKNAKPQVIEAITYRLCDHTTADDATRYQSKEITQHAANLTPIQRLQTYLLKKEWLNDEKILNIEEACKVEIEKIVLDYLNYPKPSIKEAFDYHFANMPDYLIEQRAEALEEFYHANA